jgi:hypothetical protein
MINASQLPSSADLQAMLNSLGFESETVSTDRLQADENTICCMLPLGYNPDLENSVAVAIQNNGFALYVYDPYQELRFLPWVNLGDSVNEETLRQTIRQAGLAETLNQIRPASAQSERQGETLTALPTPPPTRRQRLLRRIGALILLLGLLALVVFWIQKQTGLFILTWIWILMVYLIRRRI